MPLSVLSLLVAVAASSSAPPTDEAPDVDRMLADVCTDRAALGAPRDAAAAPAEDARRRFTERALRLRRAGQINHFGLFRQPSPKFEAWSPSAERLDRDDALHLVGAHDLADQHAVAKTLETWAGVAAILASFGSMAAGFAAGAALALFVYDPALGQLGSAAALGVIGMGAGALVGLAALPVLHLTMRAFFVDDDEALVAIQRHNRKVAEEAGLSEAEIPFEYLGY